MANYKYLTICIICVLILVCIVSRVGIHYTRKRTIEDYFGGNSIRDTIYFKVVDEHGNVSFTHDSGHKPKNVLRNGKMTLNIIKDEYSDGNVQNIGMPVEIKYGQRILNLDNRVKVLPDNVKDKGLYYSVDVKLNNGII